jgi:TRAP-type C4-dicarboxylate transport system permease small subunit
MLARVLHRAATMTSAVAVAALAALVAVTVVDVAGRYLLNKPLFGAVEISEFLLVFLSFGGLAYAELRNSHITVDFFVTALPPRAQSVLAAAAALLGTVFWGVVAWRAVVHANRIRAAGEVSLNWGVPTYPFYFFLAIGAALLALLLVGRVMRSLRSGVGTWTPPPSA